MPAKAGIQNHLKALDSRFRGNDDKGFISTFYETINFKKLMKSPDKQSGYWNSVAWSKTFTHPLDIKRFGALVEKEADILDFGCGYGRTCNELFGQGFKNVVGVDSSEKMIERGQRTYPHLELNLFQEKNLPYNAKTFDAVLLFAVLTCIPTSKGQQSLIKEVVRVLRPGGLVYISDYWLQDNKRNLKRYENYKNKHGIYGVFELPEGAIVRHHSKRWIASLLSAFHTLDLFDLQVTSMNGNTSKGFQYLGRK